MVNPNGRPPKYVGCIEDQCTGEHYCRERCKVHYNAWNKAVRREAKAKAGAAKTKVKAPTPKIDTIEICMVLDCDLPRKTSEWGLHKFPLCQLHSLTRNHLPKWIVMTDYEPADQSA